MTCSLYHHKGIFTVTKAPFHNAQRVPGDAFAHALPHGRAGRERTIAFSMGIALERERIGDRLEEREQAGPGQ